MVEGLGGVTAQTVKLALDVAVLRHQVIANNVANANTPGYQPMRVEFAQLLDAANATSWSIDDDAALANQLAQVGDRIESAIVTSPNVDDEPVEIDAEMVKLADNTVRYQALLRGLATQMAIVKLAVEEGAR